jgi:hypothetical protein
VTREAKSNLIFLGGFLLLCLPGVVLLFIKKLDPQARSMAQASYVRRTEAYNNPLPASSRNVRVIPPRTVAWVHELAIKHVGHPPLRHAAAGGRSEPVMSRDRRFELLDLKETAEGRMLVLLAWESAFGSRLVTDLTADTPLGRLVGVEIEPVPLPADVTAELKDAGFVLPPAKVGVVRLRFTGGGPETGVRIALAWDSRDSGGEDVLELSGRLLERSAAAKDATGASADAGEGPGAGNRLPPAQDNQ